MNELSTVRSAGKVIHFKDQVITLDEAPPTAFKE